MVSSTTAYKYLESLQVLSHTEGLFMNHETQNQASKILSDAGGASASWSRQLDYVMVGLLNSPLNRRQLPSVAWRDHCSYALWNTSVHAWNIEASTQYSDRQSQSADFPRYN